ncbi:MAG: hypothetical protein P1P86_07865 [Bacteroidales bacterium]|nr:hypothetical protein [Bacteroidales bacterium]
MRALHEKYGTKNLVFLSRRDKDVLIYMNSDVWITPDLKRFKNDLLEKVMKENLNSNTDR